MVLTMGDDYYRQRAAASGRRVRRESDARRDLERMHLMTIRREKMRLQEELDRVRVKGGVKGGMSNASKNAKLLSSRFVTTANDEGASQRRPRLRTSTAAASSQRGTSPYILRRNTTNTKLGSSINSEGELPQIGYMTTPLKGELDSRRHKDEIRDPKTKINELKKNEGQQKKLLSLKVDMFTRSFTPVSQARSRSPARSPVPSPTLKHEDRHHMVDDVDTMSSDYIFSPRASFPPATIKKKGHYDVTRDTKNAMNTRLVPLDADVNGIDNDHGGTQHDDVLPTISRTQVVPTQLPPRPTIIRRQSQVAILERNDQKKNKYALSKDSKDSSGNNNNGSDNGVVKKSVESELNLAVLGRDAKRVKEIIENPEIVFDQEKYAPDGALRTIHMLPTAENSFSQARQARYLRWRDPNELNRERELSVSEIFAKGTSSY